MYSRTETGLPASLNRKQAKGSHRVALRWFAALALLLALVTLPALAQITGRGTISGTVTDKSSAVIPQAQVSVLDTATGVLTNTTTNATGYFEVNNLNPGSYMVTAVASGFETLIRKGITLPASGHIDVPLALKVGSDGQTVTVTADADLLNTETGSTGQVLTTQMVEHLPVSGVNPMQMAEMAPGIQSPNGQTFSASDTLSWNGVTKFGATGYLNANEFIVDGMPNAGNPRGNAIQLSEEEVDQMKVDAVSFEAEMGHTMGAMITQTTKSGTNDFHGAVHWFYQDAAWAAMQHFQGQNYKYQLAKNNCTNGPDTSPACFLLKYQYGNPGTHVNIGSFALGGPVIIPHLYNGRKKLFFFVNVNNDVWNDASVNTTSVPTVLERTGDFSDLPVSTTAAPAAFQSACGSSTPYYGQYQIYDPFSVALDSKGVPRRQPFCGNKLPSGYLNTVSALSTYYNKLLPTPTQNSPTGSNYVYTSVGSYTFRQVTTRWDAAITQNDHAFFRGTRATYWKEATGFTVGNVDRQISPKWIMLGAFGYDHTFSASTNAAVVVGASSWETGCCYYPGYQQLAPSTVGLPSYVDSYAGTRATLPVFSVGSYAQIGQTNNSHAIYRNLSVSGLLNHVYRNHTIRAGAEWRQQSYSQAAQGNSSGTFSYDASYTQQNNGSDSTFSQSTWGLSYASFLMGIPTSSSIAKSYPISIRTPYYALFVGDNWRITRHLTLIPGVRFEYEYGPSEIRNAQIVGWDPNASLPIATAANSAYAASYAAATSAQQAVLPASLSIQGGPIYAGVNGASTRQFKNDYRILPRIAFAYQLNPKTVLRGGYGLYSDTINAHDAGGSPHSSISGATGTWSGVQFSGNQDGYSTSTSVATSTNYGQNFTFGTTPLSDPFPASNGVRFNSPVGNTVGSMYYLGSGPTIYDHEMQPTRAQRWYVGAQRQLGASTMIEVAYIGSYATKIPMGQTVSHLPASIYAGGTQPNTTSNSLMSTQVTNPFNISNFASLAGSYPAAYSRMSLNSYFTAAKTNISNLIRNYPQMSGLAMYRSLGESHFHEMQVNVTRRAAKGLTAMGAFQLNYQQDRDYYANVYDSEPSWQPSNNSMPYRITAEVMYELPIGKGKAFAQSGLLSKLAGGFQVAGTWELQPGPMIAFSNLFYVGDPSKSLKLAHPVYANNLASGGSAYVQWLDTTAATATYSGGVCSYTGSGFVTNSSCQPNSYNARVFPTRVEGLRQQSTNTVQASVQRRFRITDRVSLDTRMEAYNVLNRQVLGAPNTTPTSANFGRITSDGTSNGAGNSRWLSIQGRLRF